MARSNRNDGGDWVLKLVLGFGANVLALWLAARWFTGVGYKDTGDLLIAAAVLGIANLIIKPILTFVSCILVILTLGIFLFFINMAMVALAAWIVPGFEVGGFWSVAGTTVLVWLANLLVSSITDRRRKPPKQVVLD